MQYLINKNSFIAALVLMIVLLSACGSTKPTSIEITSTTISVAGGTYQRISASQLNTLLGEQDLLINTHIPYDGELARTDSFLPYDQPQQLLAQLPADKQTPIVFYCRTGRMSAIAAEAVVQAGYTNIWELEGGMVAWQKAGLPVQHK
jgi:phage shock protein E